MEQGRGSSIPWEKGVTRNGNVWIPSTPGKPVLQSSNNARPDIQQNQIGQQNWHSLREIYEDFYPNKLPHSFDLNRSEGPSYTEHNHNTWMMEQARATSIPWEKGATQNGNVWIPPTPDKPVNNAQSEIQPNQIGRRNWHNLLDVYEDFLRNKQTHSCDLNRSEGPSYTEHNQEGVPPAENYSRLQQNLHPTRNLGLNGKVHFSQHVAPVEAFNRFPLNSDQNGCTGVNNLELNNHTVSILQKLRSLNNNAGRVGSYVQNLGEGVSCQEVSSFADLMCVVNGKRSSPPNGSPYRSKLFFGGHARHPLPSSST